MLACANMLGRSWQSQSRAIPKMQVESEPSQAYRSVKSILALTNRRANCSISPRSRSIQSCVRRTGSVDQEKRQIDFSVWNAFRAAFNWHTWGVIVVQKGRAKMRQTSPMCAEKLDCKEREKLASSITHCTDTNRQVACWWLAHFAK